MKNKPGKKKWIAIIIVFIIAIFLLLPVFDGSVRRGAANAQGEKAVPQVATSNPLTKAMEFLASLFKANPASPAAVAGQDNRVDYNSDYASLTKEQRAALGLENGGMQLTNADYSQDNVRLPASAQYADDSGEIKDKEGNWVIVRQETPAVASRGMYDANLKEDPLSALEGRRISEQIARDNADKYAYDYGGKELPFSGLFNNAAQKGLLAASNTFSGPETNGAITGFTRGTVDQRSIANSPNMSDIERVLAGAEASLKAANTVYDAQGRELSSRERDDIRQQEEAVRNERIRQEAMTVVRKELQANLEKEAAAEIVAEGIVTLDKPVEYVDTICKQKDSCSLALYNPVAHDTINEQYNLSSKQMLEQWFEEAGAKFTPEQKEAILKSYTNEGIEYAGFKWNTLQPKFMYVILDSESVRKEMDENAQNQEGENTENAKRDFKCPEKNCYWVADTSMTGGHYDQLSRLAGGSQFNVNDLKYVPNSQDNYWMLVAESDLNTFLEKNKPVRGEVKSVPSVVTVASNAPQVTNIGADAVRTFTLKKMPLITRDITGEEGVVEGKNQPVQEAGTELAAQTAKVNARIAQEVLKTQRANSRLNQLLAAPAANTQNTAQPQAQPKK